MGRAHPWAGGTLLYPVLQEQVWTGPALPALLTQTSRSQTYTALPPTPTCFSTTTLRLLSLPQRQEETISPSKRTIEKCQRLPPVVEADCKTQPWGST